MQLVLVAARWLHFAGVFAMFGGAAFWFTAGRAAALPGSLRVTERGLTLAAPLVVASGLVWLGASLATMTGGFAGSLDPAFLRLFFLETPFGGIEIARLVLFAALLATVALPTPRRLAAVAGIAGALLVSQAWLGHAAEGGVAGWAMIASYVVHVLAGALWIGGLPVLLLAFVEDHAGGSAALSRFSGVATWAAVAVVASGTANTVFHAGLDVAALVSTAYGRVLAAKLVAVATMLALAAVTRVVTMPRLRRGENASTHRAIAWEGAAGVLVLAAAAVLGVTPPPH